MADYGSLARVDKFRLDDGSSAEEQEDDLVNELLALWGALATTFHTGEASQELEVRRRVPVNVTLWTNNILPGNWVRFLVRAMSPTKRQQKIRSYTGRFHEFWRRYSNFW